MAGSSGLESSENTFSIVYYSGVADFSNCAQSGSGLTSDSRGSNPVSLRTLTVRYGMSFARRQSKRQDKSLCLLDLSSFPSPQPTLLAEPIAHSTLLQQLQLLVLWAPALRFSICVSRTMEKVSQLFPNWNKSCRNSKKDKKELEKSIKEMATVMGGENGDKYGPQGPLYALWDSCLNNIEAGKYTYGICLFGAGSQKEGASCGMALANGPEPDLMTTAVRCGPGNGAYCWNGPQRSAMVPVTCGQRKTKLYWRKSLICTGNGKLHCL